MSGPNLMLLIARIPPRIMLLVVSSLALSAGLIVHMEMEKSKLQNKPVLTAVTMTPLLVAARDIQENETITADLLELRNVESGKLPFGALNNSNEAIGSQARFRIGAGEGILSQSIKMPEKAHGFESKIKPGYRAITFPVDTSSGVAGFLTPDCRVDILAQTGSGIDSKTVPILSDVHVVAVGQTYRKLPGQTEAQPVSSVTVEVTPPDGGKLINSMSAGKLYCLMRNAADHAPLAVRDINSKLAGAQPPKTESPEISTLPLMPQAAVSPLPVLQAPVREPSLHNIELWSANKKDDLTVPKE